VSARPEQGLLFLSRVEAEFEDWIQTPAGRQVEAEVVRRARLLQERGCSHYGIAALVEAIRYDASVSVAGDRGFKINNDRRSLLARRVMERNPDLRGFFSTRELFGRAS
jgi:hypothetical protein